MWLDLLLIFLAISPLTPLNRLQWQNSGSTAYRGREAQLTALPLPR